MKRNFSCSFWFCLTLFAPSAFSYIPRVMDNELNTFMNEMVEKHHFERHVLQEAFEHTQVNDEILDRMQKPYEKLPWHRYRALFLTNDHITGGVEFWKKNRETLERAERTFGVPAEIIVAIIGVETRYGVRQGKYPVLEALRTLAFHYPPRSEFFKKELEAFLLLAHEEALDLLETKGSYAGAMGQPQFISSSYRAYAVDFDGDGKRDLLNSTADVIGSVANYFHMHHWEWGAPVATAVRPKDNAWQTLQLQDPKKLLSAELHFTAHDLQQHHIHLPEHMAANSPEKLALMAFEEENSSSLWVGHHNFQVITKYNLSPHYAMAVFQLSQKIKQAM